MYVIKVIYKFAAFYYYLVTQLRESLGDLNHERVKKLPSTPPNKWTSLSTTLR